MAQDTVYQEAKQIDGIAFFQVMNIKQMFIGQKALQLIGIPNQCVGRIPMVVTGG